MTPTRTEVEPLTALGESFKTAMGAVRRLRGRESQRIGRLSFAQYSLLFGLAAEPELSASKLACVADLAPATVTEMLDHLEADGLVERVRSDRDKRVVLVSLTKRGRTLVAERRADWERRWRAALAEFDDAQLLTAAAVLDRLAELFDEHTAES
jgi:DNA-binding MarR family transcriptional regulator